MENKTIYKALAVAIAGILIVVGTGMAQTDGENPNASAKVTAAIGYLDVFSVAYSDPSDTEDWDWSGLPGNTVLTQDIKTANGKDLIIDVSLQTGVFTYTQVKSKNMQKDESLGMASIFVWVKVDDTIAYPGHPIVFDARIQKLSATLQGFIEGVDPESGEIDPITVPEEIELFIGTLSAHSFNFIVPDVGSGMHTVTVYACALTHAESMAGSALALAFVGLGSMTVEEVRMIKNEAVYV
jgi:hypothetical protein